MRYAEYWIASKTRIDPTQVLFSVFGNRLARGPFEEKDVLDSAKSCKEAIAHTVYVFVLSKISKRIGVE